MQIVLARLEEDQIISKAGRVDLGERHTFKTVYRPVSVMWLNDGNLEDLEKSKKFANTEGYTVFCYHNESDPLCRARKEILKSRK